MPTITHLNGQTTYYETNDFTDPWKPHKTIVIQHGFARHVAFWYHWVPALSRHYRVIWRDARGHGKSITRPPSYDYSVDTILGETVDMFNQPRLQKIHFLGESTGSISAVTTCSMPMFLPAATQDELAFGCSSWLTACRELGSRAYAEGATKALGTDRLSDKAYLRWKIDQVAMCTGEGLAGHAKLHSKMDTQLFGRYQSANANFNSLSLAVLDGKESQRELREEVGKRSIFTVQRIARKRT